MKRYILTFIISIMMAIESVDVGDIKNRQQVPVVYSIDSLPRYWRKMPVRKHFKPEFTVKL